MTAEAARWAELDKKTIGEFRDGEGIVNEFALMYHVARAQLVPDSLHCVQADGLAHPA